MPIPTVAPTKIVMETAISYHATVLIQRRVNIAIGEVKGIYEHTFIKVVSSSPLDMEKTTTMNAIINKKVIGITDVLISSNFEQ